VIDLGPHGHPGARRLALSVAHAPTRWQRAIAA